MSTLSLRALVDHYGIALRNDRGGKAMAVCGFPFHEDKGPSLSLDFDKNLFNCFGCGAGGGPIKFVQFMEGIDYPSAVAKTGEILGLEIKYLPRDTIPAVAQEAERKYALFMRLSNKHPWLGHVVTKEMMIKQAEGAYRNWQKEEKDRKAVPGKHLYFKLEGKIDFLLMDIERSWRASVDPGLNSALGQAHLDRDDEKYFSLWDSRVDSLVMSRDLLSEVKRITLKILDRGKVFLLSENKKKINLGREILVQWIGALKRILSAGLESSSGLITTWGYGR